MPLVLVMFWLFLIPFVAAWLLGASRPVPIGGFVSALVTFTLFEAAYFCEIMRARRDRAFTRHGPTVIQFDEPTSALDPGMVGEVLDVMVGLATPRAARATAALTAHERGGTLPNLNLPARGY